jgi:hypothetical protein
MLDRILSALVALSLAFLVWLYARSRDQEILDNVPLPVQVSLAPSQADRFALEVTGSAVVPVSFRGSPDRIHDLRGMLQRGELRADVTLTVPQDRQDERRYCDTVRVEPGNVPAPPGVTPLLVEGRNRIPVTLHRLCERRLPVRLDQSLAERLGNATFEPPTVLVRGPEELLDRARTITTQPYALPPRAQAEGAETLTLGPIPLVAELEGRPVRLSPGSVMAHVSPHARKKTYELDLPIHFLCPPGFALRPGFNGDARNGRVTVRVEGPTTEEPPAVLAFIDLTRREFEKGLHEEPLLLQLPKDFQLLQNPRRRVPFRLDPPEQGN